MEMSKYYKESPNRWMIVFATTISFPFLSKRMAVMSMQVEDHIVNFKT
jgi:hypothetical protein